MTSWMKDPPRAPTKLCCAFSFKTWNIQSILPPIGLSCTTLASWWSGLYQTTTELERQHFLHPQMENQRIKHMGSKWLNTIVHWNWIGTISISEKKHGKMRNPKILPVAWQLGHHHLSVRNAKQGHSGRNVLYRWKIKNGCVSMCFQDKLFP